MPGEITVAYARQSTRKQQSVDWQITWAEKLCRDRGWTYGFAYREEGGARHSDDLSLKGRPQLRQMLEDARDRKFQRVVIWDRTRLARGEHLQMLLDYLQQCGVKVFIGDLPDAGDSTEILISILQALDRHFLRALRKNTKRGLQDAREKGVRIGRVPAGFKLIGGKDLHLEIWARDREAMKARGMTPSAIARVERNVRLYDQGEQAFQDFLSKQYQGSSQRYAKAKERQDKESHEFEVWLISMRPARSSERASL